MNILIKLLIHPPTLPFGKHKFVFCICESIYILLSSFVSSFRFHIQALSYDICIFFFLTKTWLISCGFLVGKDFFFISIGFTFILNLAAQGLSCAMQDF